MLRWVHVVMTALWAAGCTSVPATPRVAAVARVPADDGHSAQGGGGGSEEHSSALEELKVAPLEPRSDRQNSVRVLLPDGAHWTRVKFWGIPSLAGFRYGKEHHAVVGVTVTRVEPNAPVGACSTSFESWAAPFADAFEVALSYDAPRALAWNGTIADVAVLRATTATLAAREAYVVGYGTYPVWKGACLVVGIAVPVRDDESRARQVRDRFVEEALPRVEITSSTEPNERF